MDKRQRPDGFARHARADLRVLSEQRSAPEGTADPAPDVPGVTVNGWLCGAWLVADLLDERATRDEFCRFMETRHKADNPRFAMVWRLLREAVDRDGGGSLDLKAVASVQEQIPRRNQWITDFIIGMFLEKRGKPAEAREFLQKALENPLASGWMVPVARDTIRKIDENAKKGKADAKTGAA